MFTCTSKVPANVMTALEKVMFTSLMRMLSMTAFWMGLVGSLPVFNCLKKFSIKRSPVNRIHNICSGS